MKDFRLGYLYSLSPIHCGGEGDIGNILEISREVHTNFPYIPGSSLRGSIRDEVQSLDTNAANNLFGKELDKEGQMGVHQVWFGDARLLWVPMRTMPLNGGTDIFTWVSCHSLIRDHAIIAKLSFTTFPDHPVGSRPGNYLVADAEINVSALNPKQKEAITFLGKFPDSLNDSVKPTWETNHIILPDSDFQVLMEHSLWTQVRNKIQEETNGANQAGSAEVFWTDICIPRDTIFYSPWGYNLSKENPISSAEHELLIQVLQGLIQVGGQANVGRGWVQSWVNNNTSPLGQNSEKSVLV
ncbi:type III-B CRISPR module RAMP protein Cmr4 [Crocosphaera sp. XPORK-15E]|uniref:type III-B CRISPR module RAMP protein Cmr4 n=1 Tax=Crocosphaera sp. XPORK-15E TaxID=3110247 RepID=UPI002B1F3B62|nr:type III-B CRISPR module RAMP protein Cmr4 [Crocosphaera sp. XPORK-15E]MEA5537027.1 type III-B CRISPR module RAMP protein Cmr4 [Crocosphaera sp. XPORK-15E]